MSYEIYRKTTVGLALEESLDELVMGGVIDPPTGVMVLKMVLVSQARCLVCWFESWGLICFSPPLHS